MPNQSSNTGAGLSRRKLIGAVGASSVAMMAGCISSDDDDGDDGDDGADVVNGDDVEPDEADVSAAWIYFAEPGDLGWTFAHNEGYEATVAAFDERDEELEHTAVEDVAAADVTETAESFADDGFDIIFGASADFTDPMAAASEQFPDVAFEVASGIDTGPNHGAYYGKIYHARYLVGYAAGLVTETNAIGYVAANPVSTVYQDINGFASGVQDANPDATVHVNWTNDWFDPSLEAETAQALIDDHDVDVMAQHQDSPSALETATENGRWASGFNADMSEFASDEGEYLMSPIWRWEEVYIDRIEAVLNDEWEAGMTFPGMESGVADVSDPGPAVPDDVVDEVMDIRDDILAGNGDEIVWGGTVFEDSTDEDILFGSDSFGIENIDGDEI